jgi:hypothetical protein
VVQGAGQFDPANRIYFKTVGVYLSHGFQWIRSVSLRGPHIWLYNVTDNEWTDALPASQYDRMNQGIDQNGMARMAVTATYAESQQAIFTFGGAGWGANNNQLHCYDAYTNELMLLDAENKPSPRDNAGLSYDEKRNKLLMFGAQYLSDENTYIYDLATNVWTSHDISPRPDSTAGDYYSDRYSSVPSIAYDSIHDKHLAVIFEGNTADEGDLNDGSLNTWVFDMGTMTWNEAAESEPHGSGCAKVRGRNLTFSPMDNMFILESPYWENCSASNVVNELWTYTYSNSGSFIPRPDAPIVTTTQSSVSVSWNAISGATQYNIYRATGTIPNLTFSKIATASSLSYLDTAVIPGTIYYYRYAPIIGGVEGRQSFFGRTQPKVMKAPVVSARNDYGADIEWTTHSAPDIAGYNLYRGLVTVHTNTTIGETFEFVNGTSPFVNGEIITQGSVTAKIKYVVLQSGSWGSNAAGYFAIYERNGGNFTSGLITGSLSGVAYATGTQSKIASDARWHETVYDGYTKNVVEMVRNITNIAKLNTSLITGTSFSDMSIDLLDAPPESADYPFAVYAYIIIAVNNFGVESGSSPYQITIPSAPTHFLINTGTKTLKWDPAPENNIVGYNVYIYARTENGGLAPVNKLNASPVSSPYVLPAGSYTFTDRFWVVAVDSLGQEGIPSVPVYYGDFYAGFHAGEWHQ